MMNTFQQYENKPTIPFNTMWGLYEIHLVRRWYQLEDFLHFALNGNRLVAVYASEEPTKPHLVNVFHVGYVKNPETLDFPQWNP